MVEIYLAILVISNLRLLAYWGVLCFPLAKPKNFPKRVHNHKILIQYPVMNEPMELVDRFLKSLSTIPVEQRSRFHLQILDDYSKPMIRSSVTPCISYEYIRRPKRSGYDPLCLGRAKNKAGNMNYGLIRAGDEFKYVAIFDSDHQVRDFGKMLEATEIMESNQEIVVVQSRWVMANMNYTLVSLLQRIAMGTHLDREQTFKSYDRADLFPMMNGAGAVINLEWVKKNVGGWLERGIIEDQDLSYEIGRRDYKILVKQDWTTLIDNPESWGALREQWKKWACANGQFARLHWGLSSKNKWKKLYWLGWLWSFALAPFKYLMLVYVAWGLIGEHSFGLIEQLCLIPHAMAWIGSSMTWDNKLDWRRAILYPFQYILELGIVDIQVRSWYKGFFGHKNKFEFTVTPK
jgi:cellulose synthase/poly-beta-1,6-N-acetylglucosamine synthase-like glycosyltransferase